MTKQEHGVSLSELLRFFLPLAVTWMLMMFTHTIISAGLSRTVNPTVSTAAYAVALSLANIINSPLIMLRQTGIAFISSQQTFRVVQRVTVSILIIVMAISFAVAYIPAISHFVFARLLGVSADLLTATITAFRVTMFLPLTSALRCLYQSVIMVRQRTTYVSIGMFVRVAFMLAMVYSFATYHWVVGPLVGAIALVGGILVEGIMAYIFGRRLIPDGDVTTTSQEVWHFYLPLVASSFLFATAKPFINASLARMPDAAVSLAAFSVATSVAWVLISPSQNVHQVTMIFGRSKANRPLVRKFAAVLAVTSTVVLLAISLSPLGSWILTDLIQVPSELLLPTLMGVRTLAFFPLIICWQEYNMGILLLAQATRLVSLGKTVNLLATIAFIMLLAPLLPGAIAAPLAQMVGFAGEGLVLQLGLLAHNHHLLGHSQ